MAGRGRGGSFGSALRYPRGEKTGQLRTCPPPDYPELNRRPVPLLRDAEHEHLLKIKQSLISAFRSSPYYVTRIKPRVEPFQYLDVCNLVKPASANETKIDWSRFPEELRPVRKREALKRHLKITEKVKQVGDDIERKLAALEGRELTEEDERVPNKTMMTEDGDDEEVDDENEDVLVLQDLDEEDFEEGTDYADQHFDNGENYLDDEEENLDDVATF